MELGRKKVRLGELLVNSGVLSNEQLQQALVRRCARAAADEGRLLQHTHSLTARRWKDDAAARVRAPVVRPRAAHLAYGRARRDRGGAKPDAAV